MSTELAGYFMAFLAVGNEELVVRSAISQTTMGLWKTCHNRALSFFPIKANVANMRDSNAKIGRNDPCPCGSGKKYKRCCFGKETAPDNSILSQVATAQEHILEEMGEYLTGKFRDRIGEAWDAFSFGAEEMPESPEGPEQLVFLHFTLLHWDPDYSDEESTNVWEGGIVARSFLQHRSYRLTPLEQSVLKLLMTEPLSFYEVLSSDPGQGLRLRDLWTENEFGVTDDGISEDALPGDILYAQLLNFSGSTLLSLISPIPIPAEMKPAILEYREILREGEDDAPTRFSQDDVRRQQEDLRELYLEINDTLSSVEDLRNSDGEPFAPYTVIFEIDSAEKAFDALAPLALGLARKELLADATFDAQGKIATSEFPWLKAGNEEFKAFKDTILAMFRINGRTLTVETLSEERAVQVRQEVERRMGAAAVYKETRVESYDEDLEQDPDKAPTLDSVLSEDILDSPQAQNTAREWLQGVVDSWASQKIPALGNRTPLEAVKDPETKQTVESMVRDYERSLKNNFPPDIRPDINSLRRILQL
jgi:hypothetical protein